MMLNASLIQETHDDSAVVTAVVAEPPEGSPVAADETTALGLVELLLKDPGRVDRLGQDETRQGLFIPRFLAIALANYLLFTVAMAVILNAAPPAAYPQNILPVPVARLADGSALGLVLAYNFGLVATTCICLPSFYFFALLAGVRMSFLQVAGQVVRCKASSAMMLVGILPIYVAGVLGMIVFRAPAEHLEVLLYIGLTLPFLAGLDGVRAIYRGVMGMAETLPPERRCRRECFLRRLTLSWAAVYTAVAPLMIYRLWQLFASLV
jgi:hypothetical protein